MLKMFGIITHTQNNKDYIKNSLISLTRNTILLNSHIFCLLK